MIQQMLGIMIILFFIIKLIIQKKKKEINNSEFFIWFLFWIIAFFLVIFIKKIDAFVNNLGFSATGIDVIMYLSIVVIFYLIFRLFIKIEKQEKNITKLSRSIAMKDKNS
jgi:hypothetical protein